MKVEQKYRRLAALAVFGVAVLTWSAAPSSALAGSREVEQLSGYVGSWSGSGVLVGGKKSETISCRLKISKASQPKINYSGRCTSANMSHSMTGAIFFDDSTHTYRATMNSSAGYNGVVVGRSSGDRITFEFSGQQSVRGTEQARVGARMTLAGGRSITVDYQVKMSDSDKVLTSTVPFRR